MKAEEPEENSKQSSACVTVSTRAAAHADDSVIEGPHRDAGRRIYEPSWVLTVEVGPPSGVALSSAHRDKAAKSTTNICTHSRLYLGLARVHGELRS
jgi:hypothetical protein